MTKNDVKAIAAVMNIKLPNTFNGFWLADHLNEMGLDIGMDMVTGDWVVVKLGTRDVVARVS